jgi:hypothetical protein
MTHRAHSPRRPIRDPLHGLAPVTDSPEWAWWISRQPCLAELDPATLTRHWAVLHTAAVALICPHLVYEWALHGYTVTLVPAAVFAPDQASDAAYLRVANAAAAAIRPGQLLAAANIPPGIRR